MSEEYNKLSDSEKKKEDWMNSKWRPMMGWMYMIVCMTDFVVFPVLWSLLQAVMKVGQITQWNPLTLQGAGLFHIAMGAVLGIAAFGRTQEKLGGANNGGAAPAPSSFGGSSNGFSTPSSGFAAPSAPTPGFGAATGGFGAPASTNAAAAPVSSGFGGSSFGGVPSSSVAVNASGKKVIPQEPDPVL
jgi:hypothetical protein